MCAFGVSDVRPLLLQYSERILHVTAVGSITHLTKISPSATSHTVRSDSLVDRRAGREIHGTVTGLSCSPGFTTRGLTGGSSGVVKIVLPTERSSINSGPFFVRVVRKLTAVYGTRSCVISMTANRDRRRLVGGVRAVVGQNGVEQFIFICSGTHSGILRCIGGRSNIQFIVVKAPCRSRRAALCISGSGQGTNFSTARFLCSGNLRGVLCICASLSRGIRGSHFLKCQSTIGGRNKRLLDLDLKDRNRRRHAGTLGSCFGTCPRARTVVTYSSVLTFGARCSYRTTKVSNGGLTVVKFGGSTCNGVVRPALASIRVFPHFLKSRTTTLTVSSGLGVRDGYIVIPRGIVRHRSAEV